MSNEFTTFTTEEKAALQKTKNNTSTMIAAIPSTNKMWLAAVESWLRGESIEPACHESKWPIDPLNTKEF